MTQLGEFETLVMLAVLHLGDSAYPPAVRTEIERRTKRTVARGAVYVTLDRLESKRLLTSNVIHGLHGLHGLRGSEAAPGRRPRRVYRVAPKGVRAVKRALDAVEQMRAGLEPVLERS
jgi:DNA-binding PadR family transcriptional regulator